MAGGLFALLDDVAAIAKLAAASVDDVGSAAAKATAKAVGVVVDDTAVTPQYVHGIAAEREIPIVRRIALGSIRNKLLIILPVALVLSQWLPWALSPILMVGGTYLAFEGAEKVLGWLHLGSGHNDLELESDEIEALEAAALNTADEEKALVSGAIRTDLILSTEIMVIALNEVASESFWARLAILIVVAIVLTIGVYGVVALIVKMDDLGLALSNRRTSPVRALGRALVKGMPMLLAWIAAIGTIAMLWVGGHLLVVGADDLGWHGPYELVHHAEHAVHEALGALGATAGWLTNSFFSAVAGLAVGLVVVGVVEGVRRAFRR